MSINIIRYGAYTANTPSKGYAKGKINDKAFKINTVTINDSWGIRTSKNRPKFNEANINDY